MKTDRAKVQFAKFVSECIYITTEKLYNYVPITIISVSKKGRTFCFFGWLEGAHRGASSFNLASFWKAHRYFICSFLLKNDQVGEMLLTAALKEWRTSENWVSSFLILTFQIEKDYDSIIPPPNLNKDVLEQERNKIACLITSKYSAYKRLLLMFLKEKISERWKLEE